MTAAKMFRENWIDERSEHLHVYYLRGHTDLELRFIQDFYFLPPSCFQPVSLFLKPVR